MNQWLNIDNIQSYSLENLVFNKKYLTFHFYPRHLETLDELAIHFTTNTIYSIIWQNKFSESKDHLGNLEVNTCFLALFLSFSSLD